MNDEKNINKLLRGVRLRDFCDGELNYTKRLAMRVVFYILRKFLRDVRSRVRIFWKAKLLQFYFTQKILSL